MLMEAENSCLLVVDIQTRLVPVIDQAQQAIENAFILTQAAIKLDIPMVVSEHYPAKLGATVDPIASLATQECVMEKTEFSCAHNTKIVERLTAHNRKQVIIAGMEAHVCVLQTALGLVDEGYSVFVVADACGSRKQASKDIALQRIRDAGCAVVTTEMVIFEWLERRASTPAFKELTALIK